MNDVVIWLNKNQGVLAAVPIIGGIILWLIRKLGSKSKPNKEDHKSQSVVIIGSHNYIEGQSIDTETEIEFNTRNKSTSKGPRIIAKINSSKNRIIQECFQLDCFGENFLLSLKDLKGIYAKNTNKKRLKNSLVIAMLKKFFCYSPNDLVFSYNKNFYSVLTSELLQKSIILEIQTIEETILKIPFHLLTESDFNIHNNYLSVILTRTI